MLDLSMYNIRKFDVKVGSNEFVLLPPKVKHLKTINELSAEVFSGNAGSKITELAELILNQNCEGIKINREDIEELTYDAVYVLILRYILWVNEIHTNPNSDSLPVRG
jgi:hypothetical protein